MNIAKNIAGILAVAIGSGYLYKYCDAHSILPVHDEINHNVGIYYLGEAISLIWVSLLIMSFAKTRWDHVMCWFMLAVSWLNLANSFNVNGINEWQISSILLLPILFVLSVGKYRKQTRKPTHKK